MTAIELGIQENKEGKNKDSCPFFELDSATDWEKGWERAADDKMWLKFGVDREAERAKADGGEGRR